MEDIALKIRDFGRRYDRTNYANFYGSEAYLRGTSFSFTQTIIELNDQWHLSISEIADIIEFIENSGQSKIDIFIGKGGG